MSARLDRGSTVVALGGGMIGDLAGTLAATYLRGIGLAQVPTTLLAQVDASIGGKVGVDLDGAKNLVGAFYPARLVLIDPVTLRTLPVDVLGAGMAEIVKIALMRSKELLEWLGGIAGTDDVLNHPEVIRRAAQEKVGVVRSDPYERGDRMLLNFGHTVGHGLEAASAYQLSHGEAISVGMMAELTVAVEQGWSKPSTLDCLKDQMRRFALPRSWPYGESNRVLALMRHDKKRQGETLRFAVPVQEGRGAVFDVPEVIVERAVDLALGAGS
jgi:3-dehydroquinate synthetase